MAIDKLVALITIMALIPTPVLAPESTGDHQTKPIFAPDAAECIDLLKSRLRALHLMAQSRMEACFWSGHLTLSQCSFKANYSVDESYTEFRYEKQIQTLLNSLGPYRSDQIPDAEREEFVKLWRHTVLKFGCHI
ncbi:MAG: hypothetical protein MHMPM18_004369 [Marteilia pararefringens]